MFGKFVVASVPFIMLALLVARAAGAYMFFKHKYEKAKRTE